MNSPEQPRLPEKLAEVTRQAETTRLFGKVTDILNPMSWVAEIRDSEDGYILKLDKGAPVTGTIEVAKDGSFTMDPEVERALVDFLSQDFGYTLRDEG